jgi:hypothetical protein
LSIDATGVAMIPADLRAQASAGPPPGPRPPSAQLASRDRTSRTRMAVVTAADVLPADAAERATPNPGHARPAGTSTPPCNAAPPP